MKRITAESIRRRFINDDAISIYTWDYALDQVGIADNAIYRATPEQLHRVAAILWPAEAEAKPAEPQFHIGKTYRQRDGQLVRLEAYDRTREDSHIDDLDRCARAVRVSDGFPLGPRRLDNGRTLVSSYGVGFYAGDLIAEHIGVKLEDCKPAEQIVTDIVPPRVFRVLDERPRTFHPLQLSMIVKYDEAGEVTYSWGEDTMTPTLDRLEAELNQPDVVRERNAAMLSRDSKAIARKVTPVLQAPRVHQPLHWSQRSPDLSRSSHLIDPCHVLASQRG